MEYGNLDLHVFSTLIKSFVNYSDPATTIEQNDNEDDNETAFARRLITGLAAENYFGTVLPTISEFYNYEVEDTTRLGCGYDFRLRTKSSDEYPAVEVKGLRNKSGGISLTPKEYRVAADLTDNFYLFVVKNFRESPFHEIYKNPISSPLEFERKERVVVQISWQTYV